MRNFLKDIHIVGVTMGCREGNVIRYCLDDLVKYCDEVIIVLDNYDKETENAVKNYAKKGVNIFYSTFPIDEKINKEIGALKRRHRDHQGAIREQVLIEARKIHEKRPIDILLWPDGDEIFTCELPEFLTDFWNGDKKAMFMRTVTPFDSFKILRRRSIFSHARIFKYRPDMTAIPYRNRTFYYPFEKGEAMKSKYALIHLALLTKHIRAVRDSYVGRGTSDKDDDLWFLDKDIRKMTASEIKKARSRPPDTTISQYLKHGNKILG